jgi:hypothetical protein
MKKSLTVKQDSNSKKKVENWLFIQALDAAVEAEANNTIDNNKWLSKLKIFLPTYKFLRETTKQNKPERN